MSVPFALQHPCTQFVFLSRNKPCQRYTWHVRCHADILAKDSRSDPVRFAILVLINEIKGTQHYKNLNPCLEILGVFEARLSQGRHCSQAPPETWSSEIQVEGMLPGTATQEFLQAVGFSMIHEKGVVKWILR